MMRGVRVRDDVLAAMATDTVSRPIRDLIDGTALSRTAAPGSRPGLCSSRESVDTEPAACYDWLMETTAATEKQIRFVRSLVRERVVPVAGRTEDEARLIARAEDAFEAEQTRFLGKREASSLITWLTALPRKPREDQPQPDLGVYVLEDGTLVLAKPNKAKTNVYTMRFVDSGQRVRDERGDYARGDWEYDPGLKRQLGSARKMTAAEAKAFVVRYGKCPRCSYKLKATQSVERGIGPVCRTYWPDWELQFEAEHTTSH